MDWSIDNGWFILTLISFAIGTPLSVMKIIDIAKKWRRERKSTKRIGPDISFVDCRARHSTTQNKMSKFKLLFHLRNTGDLKTTVYITKYEISTIVKSREYNNSEDIEKPESLQINFMDSYDKHIMVELPEAARDWQTAYLVFHYKYIDLSDTFTERQTKKLEVRRYN